MHTLGVFGKCLYGRDDEKKKRGDGQIEQNSHEEQEINKRLVTQPWDKYEIN